MLSRCLSARNATAICRRVSSRNLSCLSVLQARWRPSPRRDNRAVDELRQVHAEEAPDVRDVEFNEDLNYRRRGRTGIIVSLAITAVNGYVFYQWQLANSAAKRGDTKLLAYMTDNFLCSKKNYLAGRWYTAITAGFSHIEIWHFFANTVGVMSFYPAVAARMGVIPSLIAYLASIGGGSAASLYHAGLWEEAEAKSRNGYFSMSPFTATKQSPDMAGLGASAGVCGIFTLSVLFAPTSSVSILFIPLPAWLAWGLLTGVDSYCTLYPDGRKRMTQLTGIHLGHEAHLGGSATGLLASVLLAPRFWLRRG